MPISDMKESRMLFIDERTQSGPMKKRLFGLLLGSALLASQAFAAPRLTIPEAEFDFGFVPQNSSISRVFWLHSNGDDSLRIVNINPG